MKIKHKGLRAGAGANDRAFQRAPLARAVALTMAVGGTFGTMGVAQAQTAFSPAWFAAKGATQHSAAQGGKLPNGKPAGLPAAQQQSDAARQKLKTSIANLGLTAQSIAAEQARQAAARAAAGAAAGAVPDGLVKDGLVVDTHSLTAGWLGAKAPTQTVDGGRTTVDIEQTASRAILNWETFNVGRHTTLQFHQQADWAVLNKINDPAMRPSQIQGQIKGDGTVLIVNRNGIVFSGTSQINTRNLVAAAARIADEQFLKAGVYSNGANGTSGTNGASPSFFDALGKVDVQAGAQIATAKPATSTQGGGYAMLLGAEVRNDGRIDTPSGQTVLAAGDAFVIRKGAGTDGNAGSTTVGNEVTTTRAAGSTAGTVVNTGLITAATGDITLTGHAVTQGGVVVASTSTAKRGTVHLSTRASDDTGTVTLGQGSTTAILLEDASPTALDAQRDAALKGLGTVPGNQASGVFDNLGTIVDRRDLSRVEIVSGGTVEFQGHSMTLATGGEIAVQAVRRTLVDKDAALDVSGAVGVKVAMESNNVLINAQGNEQRDAPVNRDDKSLNSQDLWVDRRQLVLVPAGTNGYATDRWYTAGGLLEVSGYLATSGHGVGEWMAQGGTVTFGGGDVVTRAGSRINLSGGTLDVAAGRIRQTWLRGEDGQLYEVSSAPGDILYKGLYQGFTGEHARWGSGAQETFYNPLIAPQERLENGYTVGRDAGKLVIATRSAVLEGTLVGDTYQGPQQTKAPQTGLDGYDQSQQAAARGAQLVIGQDKPVHDAASGVINHSLRPVVDTVMLKAGVPAIADGVALGDAVETDRVGAIVLDTDRLNAAGLGAVRIAAGQAIGVQSALQVGDGGDITLFSPSVDVGASLTAHAGTIRIGNVLRQPTGGNNAMGDDRIDAPAGGDVGAGTQDGAASGVATGVANGVKHGVLVRAGATLDASGRSLDLRAADGDARLMAFLDGGSVSLRSTGSVTLEKGSTIDVASGVALLGDGGTTGSTTGGKGGSVQLGAGLAGTGVADPTAVLRLDAAIRGHGVKGGGTLAIESASGVVIGGKAVASDGVLAAGEASLVDLVLKKAYEVKAGEVLPVDYRFLTDIAAPGKKLQADSLARDVWYTLADDWAIPVPPPGATNAVTTADGRELVMFANRQPGSLVVPKGTTIRMSGTLFTSSFSGYVVERNVFPDGLKLRTPVEVVTPAGQIAPADFTVAAGTRLAAGALLRRSAQVEDTTTLSTDLFSAGFSNYTVRGQLGVAVPAGVALDVTRPVLRVEQGALGQAGGLAGAVSTWLPPVFQENAIKSSATQRAGASLSLSGGLDDVVAQPGDGGGLVIGEGARVRVDPGQSIALSSRDTMTVDGRIEAKGGRISLLGPQSAGGGVGDNGSPADGHANARALVVGARAVLDASAATFTAVDAQGRPYGVLTDGGSILVGGSVNETTSQATASDAFVVVREGAVLDASGGAASVHVPGDGTRTVASNGGTVQLASSSGVYLDGTVRARAGGAGASGGQLVVALDAPVYRRGADEAVLAVRDLVLTQQRAGGASDSGGLHHGHGALAADQVRDGGFSSLTLFSDGLVSVGGDLDLSLDRELRVYSGALAVQKGVAPALQARLAAPYVLLAGNVDPGTDAAFVRPIFQGGITPLKSEAVLTVQGRLVDVKGGVTLGLNAGLVGATPAVVEQRAGFDQLNLVSEGDLRFIGGPTRSATERAAATLLSTGSVLLRADQVYPATDVQATVMAGRTGEASYFDPDTQLVVERHDGRATAPGVPYSAFGSLALGAAHVEQNGIVRAPLGSITLGFGDTSGARTGSVTLSPDSLTSVSGAGLVMPYGGTADGVTYTRDGRAIVQQGVGGNGTITMTAEDVAVERGARLDLSGGGDLRGAGFVSGRGGSTDARLNPLVQVGPDGFVLPALSTNPVYAIVPGNVPLNAAGYAPAGKSGAVDPRIGQQITLGAHDVPGLPAGTYTLLPSDYALLPGAFRVELNGRAAAQAPDQVIAMRNGSFSLAATFGTGHTGFADSVASQVIVTSADVLRRYSQYNETGYADFLLRQAALNGTPRAMLPSDAKTLDIQLASAPAASLRLDGTVDFTPAKGGYGGTARLATAGGGTAGALEILADGAKPTAGFRGVSVEVGDLNALGAARLVVGGLLNSVQGPQGNGPDQSHLIGVEGQTGSVTLRQGAVLKAPEVFLVANSVSGGITIESGAGIDTLGAGKTAFGEAGGGYIYRPGAVAVVAASNDALNLLAPAADNGSFGAGAIRIGACDTVCAGTSQLYSEGTLVAATRRSFELGDTVRYGTRHLVLAVGAVNAGSSEDLAAAQARGALTPGLTLNQTVLDRLLSGDTSSGAPALQRLVLTAAESINLFGDVSLNTIDPTTGKSRLDNLVLSTPALYGHGDANEVATLTTGKLTWAGSGGDAPAPVTGGRGTGHGQLQIKADVIEFGYSPTAQPNNVDDFGRTILGFADVRMTAAERITANHQGALSVYESQAPGAAGPQYQGGTLTLTAPLVTGEGGSVNRITAGGALQLLAPAGGPAATTPKDIQTGAELNLKGASVRIDTAVALPSGRLTVNADDDIALGDRARLDLAGRELVIQDVSRFSWGGDVLLQSAHGDITQAAGSVVDLSAKNNNAGLFSAIALDAAAGRVDLDGRLLGGASGRYDAGGTLVPYRGGSLNVRAQHLGTGDLSTEFAALNARLNEGGVVGERDFQFRQGDLTIGDELKAHAINLSLDGGKLTVTGRIDASGEQVGNIHLSAAKGLTLAGGATLDAHGSVLRVDSRGQVIDSPNRAVVALDAGTGMLSIGDGARIDLRHGTATPGVDTVDRGTLELHAARVGSTGSVRDADAATVGDIAIDARGRVEVLGAKSIAVYGRQVYTDAPVGADPAASGRPYQVIDQAYLDGKHAESTRFIDGALANGELLGTRLAGLNNAAYRDAFHLRPEVEIASATPDGDMIVRGDLDLSGQRYASLNPNALRTAVYGSGEVGLLTLRAGGDLSIHGSINDGFAPPPETPDDHGWLLVPGVQAFGGDVVVPVGGVTLADGTLYPKGRTLNYAITAKNVTLPAGTVLPGAVTLDSPLTLPAGTVLAADVRGADGRVLLAAGTVVGGNGLALPAGAQLTAGLKLPMALTLSRLTWPKGAPLPVAMTQDGSLVLPVGSLIAAGTDVVLPDGTNFVDLRPVDGAGRQGRNWAVAQMLPEGSQSWSLRLVAGGDLGAADARLRNVDGTGHLTLADTHYGARINVGGVIAGVNSQGVAEIVAAAGGLPFGIDNPDELLGKTMDEIVALYFLFSWDDFGLPADFWNPEAGHLVMGLTRQGADVLVAAAGGLPFGMNSPDELVGKTETQIVQDYFLFSWFDFGLPADFWALSQGNGATINLPSTATVKAPAYSVLRTGTGDLTLVAGGNLSMQSVYGVYTAGTPTSLGNAALDAKYQQARGLINGGTVLGTVAGAQAAGYEQLVGGANSLYRAWYPDRGGNLTVDVGGHLTGDAWSSSGETPWASSSVGNWLWRQGTGGAAGTADVPTAWWINFGTYAYKDAVDNAGDPLYWPTVTGFTGLGTLGGGNASVRVGGDAGVIARRTTTPAELNSPAGRTSRSQGVVLAVGSTGRVLDDGSVLSTGGGDLDVRIGGGWNSHLEGRLPAIGVAVAQTHELYGGLVGLRGAIELSAGRIGTIEQFYGVVQDAKEIRASDPYASSMTRATGGLMLMPGDAGTVVAARGDLVLGGTGNPGLVVTPNATAFTSAAGGGEDGRSWFSLWTDRTALQLTAAGGQLVLDTRASETIAARNAADWDYNSNGGWFLLPGKVSALAGAGSIYYGTSAAYQLSGGNATQWNTAGLLLAPQGERRIELLAGQSLYGGGYPISVSGADAAIMATPTHAGFAGFDPAQAPLVGNADVASPQVAHNAYPLLTFGANTVSGRVAVAAAAAEPSRFYAGEGDIVGLRTGATVRYLNGDRQGQVDEVAAGPIAIKAGRDIVNTGAQIGDTPLQIPDFSNDGLSSATVSGNLIVHTHRNDVSTLQAGRDILFANVDVAGPGTLEITAGRNVIQNDRGGINSIGPAVAADARPGASIVVQAGVGAKGADYANFIQRYLDPANQATAGTPLADQPGKVVKTYRAELAEWLKARFDFAGGADEAVAVYAALPVEQQRIFARQVFFTELKAGGREFTAIDGVRTGSYLRGRNAIAAMFPVVDGGRNGGDLLMYGGSGIHTDLGGSIQVLTPGGAQTYGVEGAAPPATAGLITRGDGDIQLFSLGSILLGQSRVMTTFGGDILAWSAGGDINAGRGSKTTLVFTPPRRVYDEFGNVRLSPDVPSTGAGIATLNPLPEVKPGDIDLIAPLGTVDAGEAGIRVSGNINIAALHVANAANIQVKGQSAGLPTVATVNVSALTSASQAASTAATAAQDVVQREREATRQQQPSVFTVRVTGYGSDAAPAPAVPATSPTSQAPVPYDPRSPVQVVGHGKALDPAVMAQLTEAERKALLAERDKGSTKP